MKNIILAGATGLIGKEIARLLIERGDKVTIFSRSVEKAKNIIPNAEKYIVWNTQSTDWYKILEGQDAVINLSGENLMAKRWNEEHKKNILSSRINTTAVFVNAFERVVNKPKVYLSASAIGYYGFTKNMVTENSPSGKDFLAGVVKIWEKESEKIEKFNVRRINIRIGIVLDKNEGALSKMILPFKLFIGGPLGSGNQWFPWIHISDVAGIFLYALDNEKVKGAVNCCSPDLVTMRGFCNSLGIILNRPSFFRIPEFVLKIVLGESSDVIVNTSGALPQKIIEAGYKFRFEKLENALRSILKCYSSNHDET
jgi:uncharacterized protein (TIGR01777 family)